MTAQKGLLINLLRFYPMKFRTLLITLFLNFFVLSASAISADLWHLLDDETGNTLGYVNKDESNTTFYSSAWKVRPLENTESNQGMEFSYYASGNLKIVVHLSSLADHPEGYWVLVHPQARTQKSFRSERIEVSRDWSPWKILRERDNEVVDVFGAMKSKADNLSREEFQDYWIKSVEPDYYAVFCLLLYKSKNFKFTLEERLEKAGLIYDSLKAAPKVDLPAIYNQVLSDINKKYAWFKMEKGVLFFPSLDNPRVTQLTLEKLVPRLVLNTSSILDNYNPEKFKNYLALSLMYDYFQQNTSLGGGSGVEDYILTSVSLKLVADLGYGKPDDYLFLNNEGELEGIKERYHTIRKNFMKETKGGQAWRRAKDDKLSEYYYLGYQFGGLLLEVYKPEDLRSYRNMDAIKRSFSNFLKYDDSKVKQLPLK